MKAATMETVQLKYDEIEDEKLGTDNYSERRKSFWFDIDASIPLKKRDEGKLRCALERMKSEGCVCPKVCEVRYRV